MEAQKFPADFDAVIAGAPANWQTHLHAWDMNVATTALKNGQMFMTPGKLATLNKAVLAQCDALDGVKDGLLNDPRKCKFDPAVLLCKGADSDACLTAEQVEGAKLVYAAGEEEERRIHFPRQRTRQRTGMDAVESRQSAGFADPGNVPGRDVSGRQLGLAQLRSGSRRRGRRREVRLRERARTISPRSKRAAANCCFITAGTIPRFRRKTPSITTRTSCRRWARSRIAGCASTWFPA